MDTMQAFARGAASRGKELMVFDWDKAATLIREKNVKEASAGLHSDWEWTAGPILADGEPVPRENTHVYLASTWATPELELDGEDLVDCYRMHRN